MSIPTGMITLDQLHQAIEQEQIDTIVLFFTDLYGRAMGKRYDAHFFTEKILQHGAEACNYLITVDMNMNNVPGYSFTNWESGYGDFKLRPDYETLRIADWLDKTAIIIADVYDEHTGLAITQIPRMLLRQQIEKADSQNFTIKAASEIEYYLFKNSFQEVAKDTPLHPLGWYSEDYHILQGSREEPFNAQARRHLRRSGIPVECTKGECGAGQHELNISYAHALEMADRHVLYKQCLKELADQQGMSITFMAKYDDQQPGSSCHIHLSLWQDNKNAFHGDLPLGKLKASETFAWFLGGWIAHMAEMMVFYAPTVNSYKRFQKGSWAPTGIAWSHDNRTAGFRIVGKESSLRIECRIPGADVNPYLAYAAIIASGMDGINKKIEPPSSYIGNVYEAVDIPRVPDSLAKAIELFRCSSFAREAFGHEVVDHYLHFYESEQESWNNAVTDWERHRYFEQI